MSLENSDPKVRHSLMVCTLDCSAVVPCVCLYRPEVKVNLQCLPWSLSTLFSGFFFFLDNSVSHLA